MASMPKILVTGGCGFIGSHLINRLVSEGYGVRLIDIKPYPYHPPQQCGFESRVGNVNDLDQIQDAIKGCDGIIHLAGISRVSDGYSRPLECIETNIMGTATLLEAARKSPDSPWIVLSSTGEALTPPYQDSNLYGATKFAAEQFARRYVQDYGLKVLTTRFADVYGSSRDHADKVLPLFLNRARNSEPIVIRNTWVKSDFIHYEDLITGISRGISYLESQTDSSYRSLSICTGHAVTLVELAETIITATAASSPIEIIDDHGTRSCHEVTFEHDPSLALELLGFQAQISLSEGIQQMSSWVHTEY